MKRVLALVALLAWVGTLAVLVVLAVNHTVEALGALACTVVASAAGWLALTHRGFARGLGAVVALLAVAGALVILIGDGAFVTLVIYVVAVVLASGATTLALRRSGPAPAWKALPAPGRPVLIMNPWSGGGKVDKFNLPEECRRRGIEPVVLKQRRRPAPARAGRSRRRARACWAWPAATGRRRSWPRWRWSAPCPTCASPRARATTWRWTSASTATTSSARSTPTATRGSSAASTWPRSTAPSS